MSTPPPPPGGDNPYRSGRSEEEQPGQGGYQAAPGYYGGTPAHDRDNNFGVTGAITFAALTGEGTA